LSEPSPYMIFAQYRNKIEPYQPVPGRKYTITHSDITGHIYVFISDDYAEDSITDMREEVRLEWQKTRHGYVLTGSVRVDLNGYEQASKNRSERFYVEMPKTLQALRYADRFLFRRYPVLDSAPVLIQFISDNPLYHKSYDFGRIGTYQ